MIGWHKNCFLFLNWFKLLFKWTNTLRLTCLTYYIAASLRVRGWQNSRCRECLWVSQIQHSRCSPHIWKPTDDVFVHLKSTLKVSYHDRYILFRCLWWNKEISFSSSSSLLTQLYSITSRINIHKLIHGVTKREWGNGTALEHKKRSKQFMKVLKAKYRICICYKAEEEITKLYWLINRWIIDWGWSTDYRLIFSLTAPCPAEIVPVGVFLHRVQGAYETNWDLKWYSTLGKSTSL